MTSSKSYSLCLHICYYIDYTDFVVWFLGDVGWSLCFCFTQAPMARNAQNERKCNFIFPVGLYGCKLHFNLSATLIPGKQGLIIFPFQICEGDSLKKLCFLHT